MKSKMKYINIVVSILAVFLIIGGFLSMHKYNKIYDCDTRLIVEQYSEECYFLNSLTVEEEEQTKNTVFLLCGSEKIDDIIIPEEQDTLIINAKNYIGDVKLLAYNSQEDIIFESPILNGTNETPIDSGEYQLYLVGKNFCGSIQIQK